MRRLAEDQGVQIHLRQRLDLDGEPERLLQRRRDGDEAVVAPPPFQPSRRAR